MKTRELPLSALRAFATAAQWKSLTGAAQELGVTHGAVSRQIGKLEQCSGSIQKRRIDLRWRRLRALSLRYLTAQERVNDRLPQ